MTPSFGPTSISKTIKKGNQINVDHILDFIKERNREESNYQRVRTWFVLLQLKMRKLDGEYFYFNEPRQFTRTTLLQ